MASTKPPLMLCCRWSVCWCAGFVDVGVGVGVVILVVGGVVVLPDVALRGKKQ
jgi:hypothetical protein